MTEFREKNITAEDLRYRLQWLMFFRVVLASFFLGMAAFAQVHRSESLFGPHLAYIYGLTASILAPHPRR